MHCGFDIVVENESVCGDKRTQELFDLNPEHSAGSQQNVKIGLEAMLLYDCDENMVQ